MNCSRAQQRKEEARTARERRKPVRCWFSGKKVLSCEQERGKRKVKPRASSAFCRSASRLITTQIQIEVN
jgi:hypothetical protein